MSLAAQELRNRALAYVKRQIAAGRYVKADLAKWEKEVGPVVHELVKAKEAAQPKPAKTTKEE